jgi:hypothetical protein
MYIIGIDPGTTHLGVCVYDFTNDRVLHLCDFNLASYLPEEIDKGISCFSTDNVVTTNIGRCILHMVERHPRIFLPENEEMMVVIEKQMNENPNNCCVLSSIQVFYAMADIECHVLDPSRLPAFFPEIFHGTNRNRPLRKKRISTFGHQLLRTTERSRSAKYQFDEVEPLDPKFNPEKKRRSKKPTVHALDGMFYAFAACCTDPRLEFNTVEKRIEESSVTRQMLRETFSKGKSKEEKKRKSNKSPFFARKKKRS